MYLYDTIDKAIVNARVDEFRDQVSRRLKGDLTEDEFKPLRLMNGLYLQLHAYMLRVAIPYGTLSSDQMRCLALIARTYDKGYGHFTTRQNIQFNWPKLVDTPDILQSLADVEMHALQTSGNCIRNVTTDEFAGAAHDELADPRPYAETLRQWSSLHPEFSFLPRKFKIAITGAPKDRAAVKWHDIGLIVRKDAAGHLGFEVLVGGGMGRTPVIGKTIRPFLKEAHLISYMEAILRVYNEAGRRDNKYKARIKILVDAMGIDAFRDAVEAEWQRVKDTSVKDTSVKDQSIDLPASEVERITRFFDLPDLTPSDAAITNLKGSYSFRQWVRINTHAHKVSGHVSALISLKPVGGIPGDATAEQMDLVAKLADTYSHSEIRVTHAQNLVLPHVRIQDLPALHTALAAAGLGTPNAGLVSDIIACPGLDYCALANARSIPLAQKITERFADMQKAENIGELKIKISGCINSCGHHHAGHIGILGVDRKGVENYQILLGGSEAEDASKAQLLGPGFDEDGVVEAVEKLIGVYLTERASDEETFLTYTRRVGTDIFKEALYGSR